MLRKISLINVGNISRIRFVTTEVSAPKPKEEVKQTFKGRLVKYWTNLYTDYTEVAKDVIKEARDRPLRAVGILWSLGFIYITASINPDEKHYIEKMRQYNNDLILVSEKLQNPESAGHLKSIENSINSGVLRRLNLGVCSIMWLDDYDRDCKLYKCTCKYLRPHFSTFYNRIIDVGFCNKWFVLDKKMIDYDINY